MRKFFIVGVLLLQSMVYLRAEDLQSVLSYLKNNILLLNVTTNVLDSTGKNVWTTDLSKITINGRSVKVKISGLNVVVIADITPYLHENNTILLVSQGEVWIGSSGSDTVRHYATIKSIPVRPGERVFFFPLGVIKASAETYTIELEIQVLLNPDLGNIVGVGSK